MISTELFPYETFPIRLEFGEKKNTTVCFFSCEEHLQKYLERYKIDKRTLKLDYRDGKPIKSSKKHKKDVQPRTGKDDSGSTSRSRGSSKKLDTTGTVSRTRKSKSK